MTLFKLTSAIAQADAPTVIAAIIIRCIIDVFIPFSLSEWSRLFRESTRTDENVPAIGELRNCTTGQVDNASRGRSDVMTAIEIFI